MKLKLRRSGNNNRRNDDDEMSFFHSSLPGRYRPLRYLRYGKVLRTVITVPASEIVSLFLVAA